jgi:hypothetical protein
LWLQVPWFANNLIRNQVLVYADGINLSGDSIHVNNIRSTGKREEKESGAVVRDTRFGGVGGQETISPLLKVPRQCPLVLLAEVMHMIGTNFYDTG